MAIEVSDIWYLLAVASRKLIEDAIIAPGILVHA
jgi:hypothetical protein